MITRRSTLAGLAGCAGTAALGPMRMARAAPACGASHKLKAMFGEYAHTRALHAGEVTSSCVQLDFAHVESPAAAFARTVAMEFDVSELSLVTFLMAKAYGRKLVLMPAVMLSRFQHPYLVYNSERGPIAPSDLEHARVGTRLFTATTPSWVRGILADDYRVDIAKMRWITYQKPNVPEFRDPPNVSMVPFGTDMTALLLKGDVDAIVADPVPSDPRIRPVIANPDAAARAWAATHHAIQINHMVVVKEELVKADPDAVREIWRLLKELRAMGRLSGQDLEFTPFGLDENRHNIEVAIDYVYRTGLIPRRFTVDELFSDVTARLA